MSRLILPNEANTGTSKYSDKEIIPMMLNEMMTEAQAVGEKLGIQFRVSLEKRIAGAQAVGAHKTSMLQDIEAGRGIEKDALIGSIIELGKIVGIPTPHIDAVFACISLLNKSVQDQSGQLKITKS